MLYYLIARKLFKCLFLLDFWEPHLWLYLINCFCYLRQCATNQYMRKRDDPHRYCQDACANLTRCGPVIVPQHHLQVRACIDRLLITHNKDSSLVSSCFLFLFGTYEVLIHC